MRSALSGVAAFLFLFIGCGAESGDRKSAQTGAVIGSTPERERDIALCRASASGLREELGAANARSVGSADDTKVAEHTLAAYQLCIPFWNDDAVLGLPQRSLPAAARFAQRGTAFAPGSLPAARTYAQLLALTESRTSTAWAQAECRVADLTPSDVAVALSCADRLLQAGGRAAALARLHAQFEKAASDEVRFRILDLVVSDSMHPTDEELLSFGADAITRYREDRAKNQADADRARAEAARLRAAQAQADERARQQDGGSRPSWPEQQCLRLAGAEVCGYDCRTRNGLIRCARTPFGACGADNAKIVCWDPPDRVIEKEESIIKASCMAQYGLIVCGYHCMAQFNTIKCTASPHGACAVATDEISCIDP